MRIGLSITIFKLVRFGTAVHVTFLKQSPQIGLIDRLCGKHKAKLQAGGKCSQQIREDSPNLCDVTEMCGKKHLTYERCKLPQLPAKPQSNQSPSENRTLWLAALEEAGIDSVEADLPVGEFIERLWPSQARIDECRTCNVALAAQRCFTKDGKFPTHDQCIAHNDAWAHKQIGCFCAWDADISTTEDGQILDGHHRWAATWLLLHDAATPTAFHTQARSYAERLIYKKRTDFQAEALSLPALLKVAQTAHSKNPQNCQFPTNPDQAVCFQQCGLAFFQQ